MQNCTVCNLKKQSQREKAAMRTRIETWLTTRWYQKSVAISLIPLIPLSWLFGILSTLRRLAYKWLLPTYRSSLPVIVVGNLTVGGTGKTPCVQWLIQKLHTMGFNAGVILRGVGCAPQKEPIIVTAHSKVIEV